MTGLAICSAGYLGKTAQRSVSASFSRQGKKLNEISRQTLPAVSPSLLQIKSDQLFHATSVEQD